MPFSFSLRSMMRQTSSMCRSRSFFFLETFWVSSA